jgi:hypothetical protein
VIYVFLCNCYLPTFALLTVYRFDFPGALIAADFRGSVYE